MKRVLYITNIEVPYRVRFFNELAKFCDLTVLYESASSGRRNADWAKSAQIRHRACYLSKKTVVSGILKEVFSGYDAVIFGCCNNPAQIAAYTAMRLLQKPYYLNFDGETYLEGRSLKAYAKRFLLRGACGYLAAGVKSADSLRRISGKSPVIPYYFSSLSEEECLRNAQHRRPRSRTVLVVGQYLPYKGLDVALDAAAKDLSIPYKFVGMGSRTDLFLRENQGRIPPNVEVIPFLQKEDLEKEYASCAMLVLPSRQECWGLVINEAASFGMPIVSTWGSGAAVEFLSDAFPQYLAAPGDPDALYLCIRQLLDSGNKAPYCRHLLQTAFQYTIERSVRAHLPVLGIAPRDGAEHRGCPSPSSEPPVPNSVCSREV